MPKTDFHFFHSLRVRWAEVDSQGVVFHGNYLTYFDTAQTEYLRNLGYPYPQGLAEAGTDLYVVKAGVELHGRVRFDDLLEVHVRISRVGKSSLNFGFEVYRSGEDDLLVSGKEVYVNVSDEGGKATAIPQKIREAIGEFEGDGALKG